MLSQPGHVGNVGTVLREALGTEDSGIGYAEVEMLLVAGVHRSGAPKAVDHTRTQADSEQIRFVHRLPATGPDLKWLQERD